VGREYEKLLTAKGLLDATAIEQKILELQAEQETNHHH
jgi:hypothetical protein